MKDFIFALTPSPALDLGGIVDNLEPNEKSYVHDETRSPGGNAINVARILTRLKTPVIATGFLGGSTGQEIKYLLDEEGVRNKFVNIKGHSRICVIVSNQRDHRQTRLTFPGPRISRGEKQSLFKMFENQKRISLLIIGGSLPNGFQASDVRWLIRIARRRGIECIVDSPSDVLKELLPERPLLIKPNLIEFQQLTHSGVRSISGVRREVQKLLRYVRFVCVSSVEGGALLVTKSNTYFGRIPKVNIKSTVGAGDSMVGAMVAQLYRNNNSEEALLRWGLAAAAATLAQPGTAFGKALEMRRLYQETKVHLLS